MKRAKVGIVGCGKISDIYLRNLTGPFSHAVEVVACADLIRSRAEERAEQFKVPKVLATDELIDDPEIEIVLNTTVPEAHAPLTLQAIEAGKHVWVEKPIALTREHGAEVISAAKRRGVLVGCAPDSPISAGQQTVRALIESGAIGEITAGSFYCVVGRTPEYYHPDPEFFFKRGAGPMLDLGVYYITALVCALGKVRQVAAMTKKTFSKRTITHDPALGKHGQTIDVEVPTHYTGTIEFASGAIVTFVASWDIRGKTSMTDCLELYGTNGSIRMLDRNSYSAAKVVRHLFGEHDWAPAPTEYRDYGVVRKEGDPGSLHARGIGLTEMAYAIRDGRPNRVSGELAFHVLDVMLAIEESFDCGTFVEIKSEFERFERMPAVRTERFEL